MQYPYIQTCMELPHASKPPYTKLNDEHDNKICWNIIVIYSSLPLPKNGTCSHILYAQLNDENDNRIC